MITLVFVFASAALAEYVVAIGIMLGGSVVVDDPIESRNR